MSSLVSVNSNFHESDLDPYLSELDAENEVTSRPPPKQVRNKGTGAGGANTNASGKAFERETDVIAFLLADGFERTDALAFPKPVKRNHPNKNKNKTKEDPVATASAATIADTSSAATVVDTSSATTVVDTSSATTVVDTVVDGHNPNAVCLRKACDDKTITFVQQGGLRRYMQKRFDIEMFRNPDGAYIVEYANGRKVLKVVEMKNQTREGSVIDKLLCAPAYKREYELCLGEGWSVDYSLCVNEYLKEQITSNKKKFHIWNTIFKETNIHLFYGKDPDYLSTLHTWFHQ